jgi:hypothetical protein
VISMLAGSILACIGAGFAVPAGLASGLTCGVCPGCLVCGMFGPLGFGLADAILPALLIPLGLCGGLCASMVEVPLVCCTGAIGPTLGVEQLCYGAESNIPGLCTGGSLAVLTDIPRAGLDACMSCIGGPIGVTIGTVHEACVSLCAGICHGITAVSVL